MKNTTLLALTLTFAYQLAFSQDPLQTVVQTGHYAPVTCIDYSPDGKLIATGSEDKTIKIWETSTGRELRSLIGHTSVLRALRFSPGGKQVVSVAYDTKAVLWDVISGKVLHVWSDSTDEIRSAIFSPDGKFVLTGGHRTNAILWDVSTGAKLKSFKASVEVCYQCESSMAFTPDGKTLVTSAEDKRAIFWNVNNADTIRTIKNARGSCSSCNSYLDIDPTGKILLKADYSGDLFLIDIKSGNTLRKITDKPLDFYDAEFSPDGQFILAQVNHHGIIKIWETKSGKEIREIKGHNGNIKAVRFSPDSKQIVTAGEDNSARIWSIDNGSELKAFEGMITRISAEGLNSSETYYVNLLRDTELSPDGKLVAQCQRDKSAIVWDFYTGRILKRFRGHESVVSCLAISPDSKLLATGGVDRKIIFWDINTGEKIRTIEAHSAMVLSMQFSDDGKHLVSSSWDGTFKVWEVKSGLFVSYGSVHKGSPFSASLTPNGLYVVTGGLDETLKMTELDSRKEVMQFIGHTAAVQNIAFSPDKKFMLTAGWDKRAKLWNYQTGYQERKFTGHSGSVFYASFDPSGKYIVTGSDDKTAVYWDAENGAVIRKFTGHTGGVNYARITPDAKYLLTASRDKMVKIWDLHTGKEILTHITIGESEWMVKTPDGYFDATPGARKNIFFVKGNETYALDQFFEEFYKPGIQKGALSSSEKRSVGNENAMILKLNDSPPPTVQIISPKNGIKSPKNHVEVLVEFMNTGGGIDEISLMHNEKRIELKQPIGKVPGKGAYLLKSYFIDLVPGENTISVSAFSKGRVESRPVTVNVHYEGTKKSSKLYVLAIGINVYRNASMTLSYARADADSFAVLMKQKSGKIFAGTEIHTLYDAEATRSGILRKLEELSGKIEKQDVLYFYYAGHGGIAENQFYLIPSDNVSLYQKDRLAAEAISASELNDRLRKIQALKQVVILDACHSGASAQAFAQRGLMEEKALAQLSRSAGIHILAATGTEQQAAELKILGHGIFTYVVLQALQGKADGAPKDNKVTIYELKSFLDDQVPELTEKYQGTAQYPSTFSLGQDFPVVVE